MTIYLYVKTHRKTGLKYLGKTVSKDPYKYRGSGNYWRAHIKKHGYDVDTEILHECQSNEEVREWGLHYSHLLDVVNARDEHGNKIWANLREEAGDGLTSEQAKQLAITRVEDGTHHLLSGEIQRQTNLKRVADGTHPFLGGEIARQNNMKRVEDGTHPFLDGEIARQRNLKRVTNGTHNLLGGEIQRQVSLKRIEDGTHPFLGGEIQRQRVKDGTHQFLDSEFQRQMAQKRIEDGTHHFLTAWTCAHCNKSGKGTTNFIRWHKDGKCLTRK